MPAIAEVPCAVQSTVEERLSPAWMTAGIVENEGISISLAVWAEASLFWRDKPTSLASDFERHIDLMRRDHAAVVPHASHQLAAATIAIDGDRAGRMRSVWLSWFALWI